MNASNKFTENRFAALLVWCGLLAGAWLVGLCAVAVVVALLIACVLLTVIAPVLIVAQLLGVCVGLGWQCRDVVRGDIAVSGTKSPEGSAG